MHLHPLTLGLPLQASTPSSQLCSNLLLPPPPQLLYQAPPGAQQLARPDFWNVPQIGHVVLFEATPGEASDVAFGAFGACHRASPRSGDDISSDDKSHTTLGIDPYESSNIRSWVAVESNHVAPQSW